MDIRASEISAILKDQIANFGAEADVAEVGQVLSVSDGVARIYGLDNVQAGEMVEALLNPEDMKVNQHKEKQMYELACINGTLKTDDFCHICGDKGHKQFECPTRINTFRAANVRCGALAARLPYAHHRHAMRGHHCVGGRIVGLPRPHLRRWAIDAPSARAQHLLRAVACCARFAPPCAHHHHASGK